MDFGKFETMHDVTKVRLELQKIIYFTVHDECFTRKEIANRLLEVLSFIDDNLDTISTKDLY